MNKDSHNLYKTYTTLLNEVPIYSPDYDPAILAPKIKEHKPTATGDKTPEPSGYQIGRTATSRGVDIVDLTRDILSRIKSTLLTPKKCYLKGCQYDLYSDLEPDEFKDRVADIIKDVCTLPNKTTACNHAARIIMNDVLDVVALRTGGTIKASSTKIKSKINAPPGVAFRPEVLDAVAHAVEEDLKPSAEPAAEVPREPSEIKRVKDFKLIKDYRVEDDMPESAYKKITDSERRDNARIVRERLIKSIGKGFKRKGSELVNAAKLPGYQDAKIALKDLLNIGGITDIAEEESGGNISDIEISPNDPAADRRAAEEAYRELHRAVMGGKTDIRGPNE
jgi:hypothetical protein